MIPILLLAVGRSGTTYLMRLLSAHRNIVALRKYPLELRLFQYAVFQNQANLPQIESLLDRTFSGKIDMSTVIEVYNNIGRQDDKLSPKYFVEKFLLSSDFSTLKQQFPGTRGIALVRDPRDVLVSARAFDKMRGFRGFHEADGDSDETIVKKYQTTYLRLITLLDQHPDTPVVRYEDLVFDPEKVLDQIFGSLNVEADACTIKNILHDSSGHDSNHRTAHSPYDSIGRYKKEMSPAIQELFLLHFGAIMSRFCYRIDS